MNATKNAILLILFHLLVKGNKHYVVVSIDTLQKLLSRHHGVQVERRWIFYCMAYIRQAGLIRCKRRFEPNEGNLIRWKPSMATFTLAGAQYLCKKMVHGAHELKHRIWNWIQQRSGQWPAPEDIYPGDDRLTADENLNRLRKLLDDIG